MMRKGNSTSKKTKASSQGKSNTVKFDAEPVDDDLLQESQTSCGSDDNHIITKPKKRINNEGDGQDFSLEMQKMLDCFGADISKTISAKRKRLETYTQNSLKMSNKKVEEFWKNQHADRQKLTDEFKYQLKGFFTQWETDIDKSKEQEEKLQQMEELEKTHLEQQNNVHAELRKEMALLQKKILIDTQQQEMMNVRKSLQTMLF
ncbi:hypothetical protein LSH36_511g00037 [Paralvinella palmiformis]|uniref:XLR/SYCP3/FAM9 domain-containing protein n=1 Tax=Paralvinella palmiformis TaxID=53620 RepID=A0AAD9J8C9_9ANNE|nr:hypothetical protein LSH36_511g00037 [Paralvinella palmiformis]